MKKLTATTLAAGNIRQHKKRYIVMTAGVILAMIFSSGIAFFISSLMTSLNIMRDASFGTEDMLIYGVDDELVNGLKDRNLLGDHGFAELLGFAYTDEKGERNGTTVAKLDENAMRIMCKKVISGSLPEKQGEIAIEKTALTALGIYSAKPGDTIKLKLKAHNGTEYMPEPIDKTYTLTGILHDQRNLIGNALRKFQAFPSAIVSDEECSEPGGASSTELIIKFNTDKDRDEYDNISDLVEYLSPNETFDGFVHDNFIIMYYVRSYGYLAGADTLYENTFLVSVLAAVLMTVSCIGIVNSFNSNLNDRKKNIGMLRAVGATKRQLISIFGREALIICLAATPLSVFLSYFGVKLIIKKLGDEFVFKPNIGILLLCAAVSILCVMSAALIPLVKISRTSPMLAIRNTGYNRKVSRKKIKTQKQFNMSKLLAKRENTFGRARFIAVSLLLMISILLSTLGLSWVQVEYRSYDHFSDYEIVQTSGFSACEWLNNVSDDRGITNSMINDMALIPYVGSVELNEDRTVNWLMPSPTPTQQLLMYAETSFKSFGANTDIESMFDINDYKNTLFCDKFITEKDSSDRDSKAELTEKFGYPESFKSCRLNIRPETDIKRLENNITEGKINVEKLNSGEEIIAVLPKTLTCNLEIYSFHDATYIDIFNVCDASDSIKVQKRRNFKSIPLDTVDADIHAGDEIELSLLYDSFPESSEGYRVGEEFETAKEYRKTVKIGAVLSENYAYSGFSMPPFSFLTTKSGLESFGVKSHPTGANIFLTEAVTDETDAQITKALDGIFTNSDLSYYSSFASDRDTENLRKTVYIAMTSVILMFFTISTALINNSMTASIRDSKRRIGTLRAVGASLNEIIATFTRQLVSLLAYGTVSGLVIYHAVYLGIFLYEKHAGSAMPILYMPWVPLLLVTVSFAVCGVNMYIKIKELIKSSIVDNIREL